MSNIKIRKQITKAYKTGGHSKALKIATGYNLHYKYCKGCDCQSPTLKGNNDCLACGQDTN